MQLVSKISNLCGPDPPMSWTDRQTEGWADDMQSQYRALHYSASRGNYTNKKVVLSQGVPRDAAVNFGTYRSFQ